MLHCKRRAARSPVELHAADPTAALDGRGAAPSTLSCGPRVAVARVRPAASASWTVTCARAAPPPRPKALTAASCRPSLRRCLRCRGTC
eukprot:4043665-Prymnesium_polylepis.1